MLPHNVEAEKVADPPGVNYDAEGNLIIENQKALQDKIEEATALGVTVNVIDKTNAPVHAKAQNAIDAIKKIKESNQNQIQVLETAIKTQKDNNQKYLNSLKTMLGTIRKKDSTNSGEEWTEAQLYEFLLPQEDLAKSEAEKLKSIAPLSVVTANTETKLIKEHIQNDGYFRIGDYIRYTKVFRDNQTGIWVDLRLTLQKIKLIHGTDDQKLRLDILDEGKPYLQYNTDDATIKVDFLENGKENPVLVRPILGFVDVDDKQGIKMDSPSNYKALVGSDITYNQEDQIYWSASPDTTEGTLRSNWAMFRPLDPINSFTYTFFAQRGSNGGVIQGIGGVSIPYATNTHESIDIHVIKQPIYHKVSYEFVGNTIPKGMKAPADANNYLLNTPRAKSPELSKQTDSQGTWTFSGWYDDEKLTKPITEKAPVTKDEIIYGKWSLNPYTSVSVQKIWKGRAAKEAEIQLLANGEVKETKKLTANDQWKWTFNQLLTNDDNGNPIAYTITETPLKGYRTTITGDAAGGFIITNRKKTSFTPPTISSSSSESSSLPLSSDSTSDVPDIPQTPEDPPETSTPTPTPTPTPSPTPTPTPMPTPSPMPTPTPKPTPTPTKTNVNAPKTGEMQNHILDVALFGFVATAISLVILKKRKSTH